MIGYLAPLMAMYGGILLMVLGVALAAGARGEEAAER